jgi:hypothetical protein
LDLTLFCLSVNKIEVEAEPEACQIMDFSRTYLKKNKQITLKSPAIWRDFASDSKNLMCSTRRRPIKKHSPAHILADESRHCRKEIGNPPQPDC